MEKVKRQIYITEEDHKKLMGIISAHQDAGRKSGHVSALRRELERVFVVPASLIPRTVVTMNSQVKFTNLDTGQVTVCSLVFPGLSDSGQQRLSILAPIGAALIGESEGSVIEYEAPGGMVRLRIDQILFQPEAAGSPPSGD